MDTYFQQFIAICMNCTHIHNTIKQKHIKVAKTDHPICL